MISLKYLERDSESSVSKFKISNFGYEKLETLLFLFALSRKRKVLKK